MNLLKNMKYQNNASKIRHCNNIYPTKNYIKAYLYDPCTFEMGTLYQKIRPAKLQKLS